jgi:hypothetical protein
MLSFDRAWLAISTRPSTKPLLWYFLLFLFDSTSAEQLCLTSQVAELNLRPADKRKRFGEFSFSSEVASLSFVHRLQSNRATLKRDHDVSTCFHDSTCCHLIRLAQVSHTSVTSESRSALASHVASENSLALTPSGSELSLNIQSAALYVTVQIDIQSRNIHC